MEPTRPTEAERLEIDAETVAAVADLLASEQRGMVLNLVADLYPADLATLLAHLPFAHAQRLFGWLPLEDASEVLVELDPSLRALLLEGEDAPRLTALLDELDTDDAADVLGELPDEVASRVLPHLEDEADLRELLAYPEDSAGGIMSTAFVAVPLETTVAEATEAVRANADVVEPVFAVYVVDAGERLVGLLSLTGLLLAPAETPVAGVMETDFLTVAPETDQEEVARMMERYDLVSLPVVDAEGVLLGCITIDDVVDVIREEALEDLQRMSGISTGDEEPRDSVLRISRGRLPWLLIGMGGAFFSGFVVNQFHEGLEKAVVLASFIPIVTAMGGNAAIQSAAIAVQGLISGELWLGEMLRRVLKEFVVALVNGLVLALLLGTAIVLLGWGRPLPLAATVGLTMLTVIVLATTNGALMPFVLKRLGADPASAMGPFVTTLNDIIGLTVYFLIARALYL